MYKPFSGYSQIIAGFSKKSDGNMKSPGIMQLDEEAYKNRERFLNKLGVGIDSFVGLNQIHGNDIEITTGKVKGNYIFNKDALLTNKRGLFLSIRTADCLPIYIYDPENKVVGLIHAGWRGLDKKIIEKTIGLAKNKLNLNPLKTLVSIGPSIGSCHFEVKDDVSERFNDYKEFIVRNDNKIFVDLRKIAEKQLIDSGIEKENIEVENICTFESVDYFSYRRDHPGYTQAMLAVIGMK